MRYVYQSIPNPRNFSLKAEKRFIADLSDSDAQEIERIWQAERALKEGRLFNGKLFSLLKRESLQITGGFVDYKLYFAGLKNPLLRRALPIVPISVSCVTVCENHVLVGKRADFVTQFPGYYELSPSGGIDPQAIVNGEVDLYRQVHLELEEETALSVDYMGSSRLFGIIDDTEMGSIELCVALQMKSEVLKKNLENTQEYVDLQWVPLADIFDFFESNSNQIVPISGFLLQQYLI